MIWQKKLFKQKRPECPFKFLRVTVWSFYNFFSLCSCYQGMVWNGMEWKFRYGMEWNGNFGMEYGRYQNGMEWKILRME